MASFIERCHCIVRLHNRHCTYCGNFMFDKNCVSSANRARRMAKEAKDAPVQPAPEKARVDVKKFVKIGRPGYRGK